jgi:hypothetical protein
MMTEAIIITKIGSITIVEIGTLMIMIAGTIMTMTTTTEPIESEVAELPDQVSVGFSA